VPAYVAQLFDVVGKIGEGTYGVVYLAKSREPRPCLLAVKTFKPGKARPPRPASVPHNCRSQPLRPACWWSRRMIQQRLPRPTPEEPASAPCLLDDTDVQARLGAPAQGAGGSLRALLAAVQLPGVLRLPTLLITRGERPVQHWHERAAAWCA